MISLLILGSSKVSDQGMTLALPRRARGCIENDTMDVLKKYPGIVLEPHGGTVFANLPSDWDVSEDGKLLLKGEELGTIYETYIRFSS